MKTKTTTEKPKYPTWRYVNPHLMVSEEAQDGVPDFTLAQDTETKQWHIKWRTSQHWSSATFETAALALTYLNEVTQPRRKRFES